MAYEIYFPDQARTWAPASGVQSLSCWATRKSLNIFLKVEPKLFQDWRVLACSQPNPSAVDTSSKSVEKQSHTIFFFFFFLDVCVEFYSMDGLLFNWYYWWIFVSIHDASTEHL